MTGRKDPGKGSRRVLESGINPVARVHRQSQLGAAADGRGVGAELSPYQRRIIDQVLRQLENKKYNQSSLCCPECGQQNVILKMDGIQLDYCLGCRGFWFDQGELEQLTRMEAVQPAEEIRSRASRYKCPVCAEIMEERVFSPTRNLLVDYCPDGHGAYLEDGEVVRALRLGGDGNKRNRGSYR